MEQVTLYQSALFVVLLTTRINRMSVVVVAAWMLGEIAHHSVGYEDTANMFSYIVALGAGVGLCRSDSSKRVAANWLAALLFAPMALIAGRFALQEVGTLGWQGQESAYALWAALLWAQILAVLAGADWRCVWRHLCTFDIWLLNRLDRHFGKA